MTPHPSNPAAAGTGRRIDFGCLTCRDESLLGKRADTQRRGQRRTVGQRHRLAGVVGVEAVPGAAPLAGPARTAYSPPVEDDEITWFDLGHTGADSLDQTGCLMTKEEWEIVVDCPLAVVEIGVTYTAGLNLHDDLTGARIGHSDCLDRHLLAFAHRHDSVHLLRHGGDSFAVDGCDRRD